MLYVLDHTALLAVQFDHAHNATALFSWFTDLVEAGELTYSDTVLQEVSLLARDELAHLWAKTAASRRCHQAAAYDTERRVVNTPSSSRLQDTLARRDSPAVAAAAQYLECRDVGDATLITEDWTPKPTRACLGAVASDSGWAVLPLSGLVDLHAPSTARSRATSSR